MKLPRPLTIDPTEQFQLLANAPIMEAVIEVRARAARDWNEDLLRAELTSRLPDYPDVHPQREIHLEARFDPEGLAEQSRRDAWRGLRLSSHDKLHIAQFNRDGFVFSRLAPYEDWDRFRDEALRLWSVYAELAKPAELQRIGVRFINRISVPQQGYRLQDYLTQPPKPPKTLPQLSVDSYLHQDTFSVPGHAYAVNRTQAIQNTPANEPAEVALILDIDVFTTQPCEPASDVLAGRLVEMRWLKDKMFFGSVTRKAMKTFE